MFVFKEEKIYTMGKKRSNDVYPATTKSDQESIINISKDRDDDRARIVLRQVEYAGNVHKTDAFYFLKCTVNLNTFKQISMTFSYRA